MSKPAGIHITKYKEPNVKDQALETLSRLKQEVLQHLGEEIIPRMVERRQTEIEPLTPDDYDTKGSPMEKVLDFVLRVRLLDEPYRIKPHVKIPTPRREKPYIVDFLIEHEDPGLYAFLYPIKWKGLIVECYGEPHKRPENQAYDKEREESLKKEDFDFISFWNKEIRETPWECAEKVAERLRQFRRLK